MTDSEAGTEGMAVFGQILQRLMERAEIADAGELAQRMREAGNPEASEEALLAMMHGERWEAPRLTSFTQRGC